jgi:hypothetical protein
MPCSPRGESSCSLDPSAHEVRVDDSTSTYTSTYTPPRPIILFHWLRRDFNEQAILENRGRERGITDKAKIIRKPTRR